MPFNSTSTTTLVSAAMLALVALAPVGAAACGRLPSGVEVSGPVPRGADVAPVRPVIMPHCGTGPVLNEKPVKEPDATRPDAGPVGPGGRAD